MICTMCMSSPFSIGLPARPTNWVTMAMASFYRHFAQQQRQQNFPLLPRPLPGTTASYNHPNSIVQSMVEMPALIEQSRIIQERDARMGGETTPTIDSKHGDVSSPQKPCVRGDVPLSKRPATHAVIVPSEESNICADVAPSEHLGVQNYIARQSSVLQSMWDKKMSNFRCELYRKLFKGSPHHPHGSLISTWRWQVKLDKSKLQENLTNMGVDTRYLLVL